MTCKYFATASTSVDEARPLNVALITALFHCPYYAAAVRYWVFHFSTFWTHCLTEVIGNYHVHASCM